MRPLVALILVHTELLPRVLPSRSRPAREADRGCGYFGDQAKIHRVCQKLQRSLRQTKGRALLSLSA